MICKCGHTTKGNKPLCYKCYLTQKSGLAFAEATFARLHNNNVRRHVRNSWRRRKSHECEMGYGDCILRGYCNGDC